MNSISPNLIIMIKASVKASKILIRDFGEIENLQVSKKGPRDFVTKTDKKVEKIIPIAVSSPIVDLPIIKPKDKAIIIAAGIAERKILIPKIEPITNIGKLAWAIASPINPKFLFITKEPIIGKVIPTKIEIKSDLTINS